MTGNANYIALSDEQANKYLRGEVEQSRLDFIDELVASERIVTFPSRHELKVTVQPSGNRYARCAICGLRSYAALDDMRFECPGFYVMWNGEGA